MKIKKFKYKKSENDITEREVLSLYEDEKNLYGLDLSLINDIDKNNIIDIQQDYESKLKMYMSIYRNFLKEKIEYIKED